KDLGGGEERRRRGTAATGGAGPRICLSREAGWRVAHQKARGDRRFRPAGSVYGNLRSKHGLRHNRGDGMMMKRLLAASAGAALFMTAMPAAAQMEALSDPVVAHPDPESLFTSEDPVLHRNKQAALHIVRELLQ